MIVLEDFWWEVEVGGSGWELPPLPEGERNWEWQERILRPHCTGHQHITVCPTRALAQRWTCLCAKTFANENLHWLNVARTRHWTVVKKNKTGTILLSTMGQWAYLKKKKWLFDKSYWSLENIFLLILTMQKSAGKGISWFERTHFSQINSYVKCAFDSSRERFESIGYVVAFESSK